MMVHCTMCEAYMDEDDLVLVSYDKGTKKASVCPECFAELCNSIEDVPEDEAKVIRAEWEADDRYDEMMLEEDADEIW